MKKQILAVMVGLTVILGGCSKQSAQNTESKQSIENIESILQEVKKETKELKSGKATMVNFLKYDKIATSNALGYDVSGDEKFEPLEYALKGKYMSNVYGEKKYESYLKDGVYYIKMDDFWYKKKRPTDKSDAYNFKDQSINMRDDILNLLDNKDNWDVTKDGDKVTFKLKKTEEFKNLVIKEHLKKFLKEEKFSEFEYTVEYVYNTKNKKLDKLFYEIVTVTDSPSVRATTRGTLEEINKEVNIEIPEEAKKALEKKA